MSINMLKKQERSEAKEGGRLQQAFEDMTHEACGPWNHPRGGQLLASATINPGGRKFNLASIYWAFASGQAGAAVGG